MFGSAPLKTIFKTMLVTLIVALLSLPTRAAQENVIVVLDASGSMWGQIDGTPKIDIARSVMSKMLGNLNGKANIGVLTYGHRKKGDCSDIETIIPVGKVNQSRYMSVINKLSPKGKTPISKAVRMAARELRFTENKATVVLVSDGLETCEADPCALAKDLEKQGIDFTVHVVGFDLKGKDTSSLQCLAKETGGKYLAADNADELSDAIGKVVVKEPAPVVVAKPEPKPEPKPELAAQPTILNVDVRLGVGSKPLKNVYVQVYSKEQEGANRKAAGASSVAVFKRLKPGLYDVVAKVGNATGQTVVEVKKGQKNQGEIVLNAGLLKVDAIDREGNPPLKNAYIKIYEADVEASGKRKNVTGANQRTIFTLPAGKYYATASVGKAMVGKEFKVVAGQKTDVQIILAAGLLKVSILAQEGGKPETKGTYLRIYEHEKQTNGKRKRVTAGNPRQQFSLPAGKYYVTGQIGKALVGKTIVVEAGKLTQDSIVVGAGALKVVVVPAEGGKPLKKAYVEIFEKETQTDGSRKRIEAGNQRNVFKLGAGEYYITAKQGNAKAAREIVVKAGSLSETTINLNAGALLLKASKKMYIEIYKAEKNLDGSRDHVDSTRPGPAMMLPAGKYYLKGKQDGKIVEAEVDIKAGKLSEVAMTP